MRYVRLKRPTGIFRDRVTGLTVKLDDVVPLRMPIGEMTRRWINAGGLVVCDPPAAPAKEAPPPPGLKKTRRQELLDKTKDELVEIARAMDISANARWHTETIIQHILEAEK